MRKRGAKYAAHIAVLGTAIIRLVRCCFERYRWRHQRRKVAKSGSRGSTLRKVPATNRFIFFFLIQYIFWFDIFTADAAPLDSHDVCYVDGSLLFV